jgi:hypothetical protein
MVIYFPPEGHEECDGISRFDGTVYSTHVRYIFIDEGIGHCM